MNAKLPTEAHDLLRYMIDRHVKEALHILEVGCGSGAMLREFAQKLNASACGIDPFIAESREGEVCFQPLQAENVSQLNRRFDLVYSVHSLHHFDSIDRFFAGLEQILSWSGIFILVDWKHGARTGIPERYYRLNEVLNRVKDYNLKVIGQGEAGDSFYLIATLNRRCLAVATDEQGQTIFPKMFGQAPYFDLYLFENGKFRFIEKRKNIYQTTMQHEKTLDVYGEVSECQALLARRIGRQGQQRLKDKGVRMFFAEGEIEKAIKGIVKSKE